MFNNTLTNSPFRVTEKLRSKITELWLFGFGTKQTCLLSLNEFKFLILKITTTACPGCSLTFLSKKIGTLFSSVIILVIGFLTYFRSFSNPYQTIVQVNHHVKIPDKISAQDKLVGIVRILYHQEAHPKIPSSRVEDRYWCPSCYLDCSSIGGGQSEIRWNYIFPREAHSFPSFYRPHTHYRSCVQKPSDSDFRSVGVEQMCGHICFRPNVYSILFNHGVMAYSADFEFLLTQIDLPHLFIICCHISPSVDTDSIHVQHHLIRSIDFHVTSMKFLYERSTRC